MIGNEQDNYAQHQASNAAREERIRRIAHINDECRKCRADHLLMITPGIRALSPIAIEAVVQMVRDFNAFGEDNDPHGEHDFGAIDYEGRNIFWKIDYYDKQLEFGSPDPADPDVTQRVLTIMLASEY